MDEINFNAHYLRHTLGKTYESTPPKSFPFPPSEIPECIETNEYFIEEFSHFPILRHVNNPFLIIPVLDTRKEIDLPSNDGNIATYYLTLFYVYFEGVPYSVGYSFGKDNNFETVYFVERHSCSNWDELIEVSRSKPILQLIHESVPLTTVANLNKSSEKARQQKFFKYLNERNLAPKGQWESKVFRDNFGNNPFILTDEEFEMIFGIER